MEISHCLIDIAGTLVAKGDSFDFFIAKFSVVAHQRVNFSLCLVGLLILVKVIN